MELAKPLLLNMLSSREITFFIPPFQRNYEWTEDQCEVFLNDILKTCKNNLNGRTSEHFFGSITYHSTPNTMAFGPATLVLIDGQQRITTTMLFLAAIRDLIKDSSIRQQIDTTFLKNEHVSKDNNEHKIKLKQVEADWDAYKKIILEEKLSAKEQISSVYANYQYFKECLQKLTNEDTELFNLIKYGLCNFRVVSTELFPEQNLSESPQEIFESMNSLGKPLSLADLVRNYLLLGMKPKRQDELYRKYWLPMERDIPKKMSSFVRDFMQFHEESAFPVASESNFKNLYRSFKSIFETEDSEKVLSDLSKLSSVYAEILGYSSTGDYKIDVLLQDLRTLNTTTAYSFLLSLLNEWHSNTLDAGDLCSILSAFRTYILRRRLIRLTAGENKSFPRFARYIPELKKVEDKGEKFFEFLAQGEFALRLPNDNELSSELKASTNFYSLAYSKFCLALVEESMTKNRPDIFNDEFLQVEHIMPQTLSKDWETYLGEVEVSKKEQFVHSIGNLTLIRHNQELGNRPFSEKKAIYSENEGLSISRKEIVDVDKWDTNAIMARANWIVGYLIDNVLPIPEGLRQTNNYKVHTQGKRLENILWFKELNLIGEDIVFIDDPGIVAHVVSDTEVEFEGKKWKLATLTREIKTRLGKCNKSGSYQGAQYWLYDGVKIAELL